MDEGTKRDEPEPTTDPENGGSTLSCSQIEARPVEHQVPVGLAPRPLGVTQVIMIRDSTLPSGPGRIEGRVDVHAMPPQDVLDDLKTVIIQGVSKGEPPLDPPPYPLDAQSYGRCDEQPLVNEPLPVDDETVNLLTINRRRLVFSILITIFCNPPLGLVGITFLLVARQSYQGGQKDMGNCLDSIGLCYSLTGLGLSVVALIGLGVYFTIIANTIKL